MIPKIFDNKEEEGIDLVLDLENGMAITLFLNDDAARDFVDLIDNKLIARNK